VISIEIIKISGNTEDEPVKYDMKIIGKEGESQQSVKEKFEDFKKGLESTILFKHPEYGASIHFSNPYERLILEVAYLYRTFALLTIREIAREQDSEVQEKKTP